MTVEKQRDSSSFGHALIATLPSARAPMGFTALILIY